MAVEGSLDLFQLPEILQIIAQEKKTGILTVQGENDIVAISFLDGRVVAADALNQTLEDGLGEVLLEQNLVSQQALDTAVAEQRRSGGRLIDILVDGGSLERTAMLEALRQLTYRLLENLLGWRSGEFKFYSGDEVSYEPGFVPISVQDLLLRSLPRVEPPEASAPAPPAAAPQAPTAERAPTAVQAPTAPQAPAAPSEEPSPPTPSAGEVSLGEMPLRPAETQAPAEEISVSRPSPPSRVQPRAPAVEDAAEPRVRGRARPPRPRQDLVPRLHLPGLLALLALLALGGALLKRPTDLILPLPFSGEVRAAFESSRWHARFSELGAAVKTYCLLEGHLPTDLRQLVGAGLVTPAGARGPDGRQLSLVEEGDSYRVLDPRPGSQEQGSEDESRPDNAGFTGSIRGDFLLDADFLRVPGGHQTPPLVLLD